MFKMNPLKKYFNNATTALKDNNVIKIEKPYVPKNGDVYWVVEQNGSVYIRTWRAKTIDLNYFLAKNCFKTAIEAENKSKEIVKTYNNIKNA